MSTGIGYPSDVIYEEPGQIPFNPNEPAQNPQLDDSCWEEYNLLTLGTANTPPVHFNIY